MRSRHLSRFDFNAGGLPLLLLICLASLVFPGAAANLVNVPELGLRLPGGFRVSLYAAANLANDIYAMTINPRGDVVVTSQGYVRTLLDRDDDGVADDAIDFAETRTGGMGLCFDGNDLLLMADGALWRLRDANADGRADGPAQKLHDFNFGEHGGHGIRQGPDGRWYVIAGNDNKFDGGRLMLPSAAGRGIEGGALLQFSRDFRDVKAFAHGFRNSYDFDFNLDGDIFTYDSDGESDYFLPWYEPTRIYHVAPGQHHGWRLPGHTRSWPRPDYYSDTVEILERMGRGSPTGVVSYRHLQFPARYRDGLFALDWTFGRVYFLPLQPRGASYQSEAEIFLESIGSQGFAPTDVAVGYDGSLFISTGGRKTRGAVYRVEYEAEPALRIAATNWIRAANTELAAVLAAPQPLEAWSRAWWMPVAERLGANVFLDAATDTRQPPELRIRAIEVLTEMHGGLSTAAAATAAQAVSPFVRARAAWSLDAAPCPNFGPILLGLARDVAANVRVPALEGMRRHAGALSAQMLQQALAANLAHPEKRVRLAAAALASELPDPAWNALWAQQQGGLPQAKLTTTLSALWRGSPSQVNTAAVETATTVLKQGKVPDLQLQAVRLILLGLGDYHLENPAVEVFTGYEPALTLDPRATFVTRIQQAATPLFPTRDATTDFELARLLAFVQATDPTLPGKIASLFTERSAPSADFHYLAVLARLKSPWPTNLTTKLAVAIVSLDRKLDGLEVRPKRNWTPRLTELVPMLLRRDPKLADAMLRHPEFIRPGNLALVSMLGSDRYLASARLFFDAARRDPKFPWSAALVDLLSALPEEEVLPVLRKQWANIALRDRLTLELARKPVLEDRAKFLDALASTQSGALRAAMSALLKLPPDTSTKAAVAILKVLRGAMSDPKEQAVRAQALALLNSVGGRAFKIEEQGGDLRQTYQPVFDWFATKHPGILRQLELDDEGNPASWDQFYRTVSWAGGDSSRGAELYRNRGCQVCHSGAQATAPGLGGVASRFSPTDLFNAIIFPNRDVAPAYRMTTFQMRDGASHTGMIAFESADGLILRTGLDSTARLAAADIQSRQASALSFMPAGLLRGMTPQEFADLYAYLKALAPER